MDQGSECDGQDLLNVRDRYTLGLVEAGFVGFAELVHKAVDDVTQGGDDVSVSSPVDDPLPVHDFECCRALLESGYSPVLEMPNSNECTFWTSSIHLVNPEVASIAKIECRMGFRLHHRFSAS